MRVSLAAVALVGLGLVGSVAGGGKRKPPAKPKREHIAYTNDSIKLRMFGGRWLLSVLSLTVPRPAPDTLGVDEQTRTAYALSLACSARLEAEQRANRNRAKKRDLRKLERADDAARAKAIAAFAEAKRDAPAELAYALLQWDATSIAIGRGQLDTSDADMRPIPRYADAIAAAERSANLAAGTETAAWAWYAAALMEREDGNYADEQASYAAALPTSTGELRDAL